MVNSDFYFPQVLDKLLLYLRIVHSLDYYNTCEYPNEDEMPNRCGIIHVRGPMPPNRISHGEGGLPASPFLIPFGFPFFSAASGLRSVLVTVP